MKKDGAASGSRGGETAKTTRRVMERTPDVVENNQPRRWNEPNFTGSNLRFWLILGSKPRQHGGLENRRHRARAAPITPPLSIVLCNIFNRLRAARSLAR